MNKHGHSVNLGRLVGLAVLTCLCCAEGVAAQERENLLPVELSSRVQLFLDDHSIAASQNISRRLEQPRKHPRNPLIVQDQPWEKRFIELYGTVLYDPRLKKFRCWYVANEHKDGIPDTPQQPTTAEYYVCYAESTDGIEWTKPLLGQGKFGTHDKHNIVIPGGHGFCVLATPDDPDPQGLFKGAGGPLYGSSPDGIRWTTHNWRSAVGKNDTNTSLLRHNGEYLAYVRYQVQEPKWPAVMRGVGLCTSRDFEHWTPKRLIFTSDEQDGYPWTQPYSLAVTPYGDQLIGIVSMLRLDRIAGNNALGDQSTQLLVSRDGRRWQRVADRQEFLAPTPGSWDQGRVFPGTTLIVKDLQVLIYYTGTDTRHGSGTWGATGIGLATLPADRFVAVQQRDESEAGMLQTHPLRFEGTTLLVNADVREGGLQVELLDPSGNVLKNFARGRCRLSVHDPLRYRVTWQSNQGESNLRDAPPGVAIRFILQGAKLYAFEVRK